MTTTETRRPTASTGTDGIDAVLADQAADSSTRIDPTGIEAALRQTLPAYAYFETEIQEHSSSTDLLRLLSGQASSGESGLHRLCRVRAVFTTSDWYWIVEVFYNPDNPTSHFRVEVDGRGHTGKVDVEHRADTVDQAIAIIRGAGVVC